MIHPNAPRTFYFPALSGHFKESALQQSFPAEEDASRLAHGFGAREAPLPRNPPERPSAGGATGALERSLALMLHCYRLVVGLVFAYGLVDWTIGHAPSHFI